MNRFWIDPWSAVLLFLTCFWGPLLAIKSARRLGSGPLPIGRQRLFLQTIVIQAILFGVSFIAARRVGVPLVAAPPASPLPWLIAAALVIVGVVLLYWRWASRASASKYRLYSILPHTPREYGPYLILCLAAGIGEEYAYRGMLYAILHWLNGSVIASVLIASVAFALAHALQGPRGMFAIFIIALIAHALVLYAHTLLPAIVAHAVYDAIAGWLIPRLYERDAGGLVAHDPAV